MVEMATERTRKFVFHFAGSHGWPPHNLQAVQKKGRSLSLLRACYRLRGCFNQGVGRQLLVQYCQFATISLKKSFEASS